jgi:hypothetical protein
MVHFKETGPYREFMMERVRALHGAVERNDMRSLPKCPDVKCRYKDWQCAHFNECGEGR